ncbi:LLM class flavin-dependent oxidoreductase, partial [Streptomyces sp. me109]|uniref:LLM class flavin-dependent oxidoreductase n=1 Tax=Streptomyces sp. me109 TaxID=1827853 RepID=UPI0011CD3D3C
GRGVVLPERRPAGARPGECAGAPGVGVRAEREAPGVRDAGAVQDPVVRGVDGEQPLRGGGGRDTSYRVDYRGGTFSVTGPPTGPPPPQGHPVRVVDATGSSVRRTAARYADVALLRVTGPAQARALRAELRDAAAESGRAPDTLRVLGTLTVDLGDGERAAEPGHGGGGPRRTPRGPLYRGGPVGLAELITLWHESEAVDGFHLIPAEPHRDLERLVNGTVALLQHRGLFRTFYPGSTLREHLRLARPAGRYAVTR